MKALIIKLQALIINASFDYKNKTCIYRLLPMKNNFAIKEKEV